MWALDAVGMTPLAQIPRQEDTEAARKYLQSLMAQDQASGGFGGSGGSASASKFENAYSFSEKTLKEMELTWAKSLK